MMAGCESTSSIKRLLPLCLLLIVVSFHKGSASVHSFTGTYGINYGRIANNIPSPDKVVKLLKASKIKNVRIYDTDQSVLNAFRGSGLQLIVGLSNEHLRNVSSGEDRAMAWLKGNVLPFYPQTNIVGIAVGNEVLANLDQDVQEALVGAVKNVHSALYTLGLADKIEVNTPHSQAIFANSYPPSSCTFKQEVLQYMKPLLDIFSQNDAPFYINIYPFLAYNYDTAHIDIRYALFESNNGIYDEKTHLHYDNMFDASIDAAYAALAAAGYNQMEVRISETGWGSHGDNDEPGASVENARTYNFNLRKRLAMMKGTPFRPHRVVKAYIFALFNENLKSGKSSEKNYGLFKADGSIAYDIGFKGLKSSASSSVLSFRDMRYHHLSGHYSIALTACTAVLLLLLLT